MIVKEDRTACNHDIDELQDVSALRIPLWAEGCGNGRDPILLKVSSQKETSMLDFGKQDRRSKQPEEPTMPLPASHVWQQGT